MRLHLPLSTTGLVVLCTGFGLGLAAQPTRWSATPAYGNLLLLASPGVWALCYLAVALALTLGLAFPIARPISVAAHALAFMLFIGWWTAFLVRWITDNHTTIVNVMSWATFVCLVVYSMTRIPQHKEPPVVPVDPSRNGIA